MRVQGLWIDSECELCFDDRQLRAMAGNMFDSMCFNATVITALVVLGAHE